MYYKILGLLFIVVTLEYPFIVCAKQCYQCSNRLNGANFQDCPKDGSVNPDKVYKADCKGHCFTRTNSTDPEVIYRGCVDEQYGLPDPMPKDGCYEHKNSTWCICNDDLCNAVPLGNWTGIDIFAHLNGPKECYTCGQTVDGEYYSYCPSNTTVNETAAGKQSCDGYCLTRTESSQPDMVYRGCLDSIKGLPYPLPPTGCYPYRNETWCICNGNLCNENALGKPNDVTLDDHVKGIQQCHVCRNYAEGQYYPHCPLNSKVIPESTWKENCTGACFTRTDDIDERLVYRGCIDSQYGLPKPLPPDGCYTYYLEVWCICHGNLCNGDGIGIPTVEFDSHIKNGTGTIHFMHLIYSLSRFCLFYFIKKIF
ncbi:hypothetical protein SNE40_001256 [Patella caerulea]|uniref:Uncharacterized protein n=1 Tax=Patella caerulea TaxID=87958 RepID=A0AAN8K6T8_PATCE